MNSTSSNPSPGNICNSNGIVYIFVQLITFILNFIAAVILWSLRSTAYRKNKSHLVIRVLVLSDTVSSLVAFLPPILSCTTKWMGGRQSCIFFGYVSTVFLLWSAFIVLIMCTLRYLAMVRPFFFRSHVSYSCVKLALAGTIVWSALHLALPAVGIGSFKFFILGKYCAYDINPVGAKDKVLVHITVWEGIVVVSLLIFFVIAILKEMRTKRKLATQLSIQQRRASRAENTFKLQEGYTTMTTVIVGIFLMCYIPYLVSICFVFIYLLHLK